MISYLEIKGWTVGSNPLWSECFWICSKLQDYIKTPNQAEQIWENLVNILVKSYQSFLKYSMDPEEFYGIISQNIGKIGSVGEVIVNWI